MASPVITDGQFDFSGGIDSGRVPTIRSELTPNGLKRNQLAWATNVTMRGGGVLQRTGWAERGQVADGTALFQGGFVYEPDNGDPYMICSIGGVIYKVLLDDPYTVTNLSAIYSLYNPPTAEKAYFVQAEMYLIIQAGDYGQVGGNTLPLFWNDVTLRRSIGITDPVGPGYVPNVNEIPPALAMDYYQGRVWYAQGRKYSAGDIVGGPSGTPATQHRDAIINVTENPLAFGGDGFVVPSNAGNIRALAHTANLDTTLGQGSLYIFTRKVVYKLDVPITRSSWISATAQNMPTQTIAQQTNGTYSDRSIVSVNGDLFYQAPDGIRSLLMAIRYFAQWGNVPISNNEERLLQFNDRSLMRFCSGVEFDNRLLQTALPITTPAGVVFQEIIPLDFDLICTLDEKLPPAWEGMLEGLNWLQLYTADFGGRERAYGLTVSKLDGTIKLVEITDADRTDDADKDPTTENGDRRVVWQFETPAYTWGKEFNLKELVGGEIWVDKLYCTLDYEVHYRVDMDPCWEFWHRGSICTARSTCEDVNNPVCYPQQDYREGYKLPITLPRPPFPPCAPMSNRPKNQGFQFQMKISFRGWARVRSILIYGTEIMRSPYQGLQC